MWKNRGHKLTGEGRRYSWGRRQDSFVGGGVGRAHYAFTSISRYVRSVSIVLT